MKHQGVNYLLEIFTTWTTLVLLWHLLSYTFFFFLPASYFFDYLSIATTKPVFSHNETVLVQAVTRYHRDVSVEWQDTLRCPPIDFYNQATTYWFKEKDAIGEIRVYQNTMPPVDSECFIDSTVTITTNYGIRKSIRQQSEKFLISNTYDSTKK